MSLFGKILALLNIFGAFGLIYLASQDYARRQAWAQSQFLHDLTLNGLPVDEQQRTSGDVPEVDLLGEEPLRQLFAAIGGSNPVRTQVEEVKRVQGILDGKLQPLQGNVRAQTYQLAAILLPLANTPLDREQLVSCRSWLADDARAEAHKKRYVNAFREATTRPPAAGEEPRPFEEAFRTALRQQGGLPSDMFTSLLLKSLGPDPAKANIEAQYDVALQLQRQQLEGHFKELFAAAINGPSPHTVTGQGQAGTPSSPEQSSRNHRAAIARLIFGLCTTLAQDALLSDPQQLKTEVALQGETPGTPGFALRLVDTKAYQYQVLRCLVVCGLKDGLDAISERTAVLRRLNDDLVTTMSEDRLLFVADHAAQLEEVKKLAALLQAELASKVESERKLAVHQELVKKRQRDVKQSEDDYKELRARTAEKAKELAKLSQTLLEDRIKARDLIRKTEESYQTLRNLENKIRELEGTK
jgi:hypothetical protein